MKIFILCITVFFFSNTSYAEYAAENVEYLKGEIPHYPNGPIKSSLQRVVNMVQSAHRSERAKQDTLRELAETQKRLQKAQSDASPNSDMRTRLMGAAQALSNIESKLSRGGQAADIIQQDASSGQGRRNFVERDSSGQIQSLRGFEGERVTRQASQLSNANISSGNAANSRIASRHRDARINRLLGNDDSSASSGSNNSSSSSGDSQTSNNRSTAPPGSSGDLAGFNCSSATDYLCVNRFVDSKCDEEDDDCSRELLRKIREHFEDEDDDNDNADNAVEDHGHHEMEHHEAEEALGETIEDMIEKLAELREKREECIEAARRGVTRRRNSRIRQCKERYDPKIEMLEEILEKSMGSMEAVNEAVANHNNRNN